MGDTLPNPLMNRSNGNLRVSLGLQSTLENASSSAHNLYIPDQSTARAYHHEYDITHA